MLIDLTLNLSPALPRRGGDLSAQKTPFRAEKRKKRTDLCLFLHPTVKGQFSKFLVSNIILTSLSID